MANAGLRRRCRLGCWGAAFVAMILAAAAHANAGGTGDAIPILVYHRFDPATGGPTTVTVAAFQNQLAWLAAHHYRIIPLRTALSELEGRAARPPDPAVTITADDGHESVYAVLFPLIKKARIPVTLFIYPSAISNAPYALTWAQLREMQASGLVDVQSHTYWHPNFKTERRRRTDRDYEAFVDSQLGRSKAVIEKQLGGPVDLLAWPYGIFDAELEAAARRAGYSAAFAYAGGPATPGDDHLALPRIPVSDADRGARFGTILTTPNHRRQGE